MRILLVAPDQIGIDAQPEVDLITSLHTVHVLQGSVSKNRLYNDVRNGVYDIIHFATHSSSESICLSEGDELFPEEVAQLARLSKADLLFFNSCTSGRMADYSIRHGVKFAIHTNVELDDDSSWKMPLAFYKFLRDQKDAGDTVNFVTAFLSADTGEGIYGLSVSQSLVMTNSKILEEINSKLDNQCSKIDLLQKEIYVIGAGLVLSFSSMLAILVFFPN